MSIKIIKQQILNFLSTDTPEVMAIKGKWGVGKTYSWKKYLNEANSQNKIKLERYSYVSLFGINSLEAFKYTIFENVVKKNLIGTEANIDTFKKNASGLIESLGRQSFNLLRGAPLVKNFSSAIETISFLSLNNTLICIDDLERKGSDLELKDILGLISLLKEQKKCKIVILLNDEEEGIEQYSKYKEKVVDIELKFEPSSDECATIAYTGEQPFFEKLKNHVTGLGIRNIRILKKIERLVDLSMPIIREYEPEVSDQVLHSLTLFTWCYYCSNGEEDIPTLDFVLNKGYSLIGIGDKEENEKEKKWRTILQEYNYQLTDGLDLVLAEAVKTGFFVEDTLKIKADAKNQEVIAAKSEGSFSAAWRLYHDTFQNNEDEVISTLYESFKKNCKFISPLNLNGTITLFRELGEDKKASEIIDHYIAQRKGEIELFNLEENDFFSDIKDPEITKKFKAIYKSSVTDETAKEVLARIAGKSGWDPKDEVILSNTTVDEYYDLFKSESGWHLSSYVNTCLRFGRFSNPSEQQKEIAKRATEALKRIGAESEINKRRVKKYGIEV